MILKAWGDWALFQELLTVLRSIGDSHCGVSIANVATRWVLDQPAVGAVIIGERKISSPLPLVVHLFPVSYHYNFLSHPSRLIVRSILRLGQHHRALIHSSTRMVGLTWGPIVPIQHLRGSSALSRRSDGNRRTQGR